jgi:HEAT repeat protein
MRRQVIPWCLLAVALVAGFARAESTEVESVALGALVERAEAAVVAVAVDETPEPDSTSSVWTFRVEEALRGAAKDQILRVRLPVGRTPVAREGRFLAFLRPGDLGTWAPLELPWALRPTVETGVAPLVEYARTYAACLAIDGTVARGDALVAHLVASLGSDASGVPSSAGRDLLRREEELAPLVTPAQRDAVTVALRRPRRPDHDFAAVVLAAGAFGGAGADDLLVERLLDPSLRTARRHVVQALARRASGELVRTLAGRIAAADAAQRADLANALGRLRRADAEGALVRLVADDEAAVRVEAAHALGLLARAVREPRPGVDPAAPRPRLTAALTPLLAALERSVTRNERRATLWAIAQIDVPSAWDALRAVAKDSADAGTREIAAQVIARPRTALVLD